MNSAKFAVEIEKLVKNEKLNYIDAIVLYCEDNNIEIDSINKLISKPLKEKLNYIDAIVLYCEENSIEIDSITKLISKPLKEKLKCDAQQLNFMKKTTRAKLPL